MLYRWKLVVCVQSCTVKYSRNMKAFLPKVRPTIIDFSTRTSVFSTTLRAAFHYSIWAKWHMCINLNNVFVYVVRRPLMHINCTASMYYHCLGVILLSRKYHRIIIYFSALDPPTIVSFLDPSPSLSSWDTQPSSSMKDGMILSVLRGEIDVHHTIPLSMCPICARPTMAFPYLWWTALHVIVKSRIHDSEAHFMYTSVHIIRYIQIMSDTLYALLRHHGHRD